MFSQTPELVLFKFSKNSNKFHASYNTNKEGLIDKKARNVNKREITHFEGVRKQPACSSAHSKDLKRIKNTFGIRTER